MLKKGKLPHRTKDRHFFAGHISFCILTGTAAISVGLSTVQSPLLPFLILLDCNKEKNQFMKLKTKQGLKTKGLTKGGDRLACNLFKSLPLFLCHFALIEMERVMINTYFNQKYSIFYKFTLFIFLLLPPSSTCFLLHLPLEACFAWCKSLYKQNIQRYLFWLNLLLFIWTVKRKKAED